MLAEEQLALSQPLLATVDTSAAIAAQTLEQQELLEKEFQLLEDFSLQQEVRMRPWNPKIDRFNDTMPFSDNMIALEDGTAMSASPITLATEYCTHNFIASHAPISDNCHLFWQMVWEQGIQQIVMTTELLELRPQHAGELCYPYWQDSHADTLALDNGIDVQCVEEEWLFPAETEKLQIRRFRLQRGGESRFVIHYWYRHWLDNSIPRHPHILLKLIEVVQRDRAEHAIETPILAHCAAGVGRTGVFIALFHALQHIQNGERPPALFDLVTTLRQQRPYMIAVYEQYAFCHAILEKAKQ